MNHEKDCKCTHCTIYKDEDTKKSCGHPIDDVNLADGMSCYYCVEEATDRYAEAMDNIREEQLEEDGDYTTKDGDDNTR